jgi:hypothetical protein
MTKTSPNKTIVSERNRGSVSGHAKELLQKVLATDCDVIVAEA